MWNRDQTQAILQIAICSQQCVYWHVDIFVQLLTNVIIVQYYVMCIILPNSPVYIFYCFIFQKVTVVMTVMFTLKITLYIVLLDYYSNVTILIITNRISLFYRDDFKLSTVIIIIYSLYFIIENVPSRIWIIYVYTL